MNTAAPGAAIWLALSHAGWLPWGLKSQPPSLDAGRRGECQVWRNLYNRFAAGAGIRQGQLAGSPISSIIKYWCHSNTLQSDVSKWSIASLMGKARYAKETGLKVG
ncbi:hypothetical protein [Rhodoferax sp.]|uniref:hypothetical protein n=1 Tax=Rhodoferax sp. TaxID=50421 RepID=UPI00273245D5|nr:hypothetical protein [Rhodoferax sp.]MDP3191695.1 hypothetical protein [Rhodoferax sp.]